MPLASVWLAALKCLFFFSTFLGIPFQTDVSAVERSLPKGGEARYLEGKKYVVERNRYLLRRLNAQDISLSQNPDGSWGDIDYMGQSPAAWEPMQHLDRLAAVAVAYSDAKNNGDPDERLGEVLVRGLRFWTKLGPRSNSWWFRDIGVPIKLTAILSACQERLASSDLNEIRDRFLPNIDTVPPERLKGQNSIWYSKVFFGVALIFKDENLLLRAKKLLEAELTVGEKEGVQPDYSFHQHGNQFYTGGYGFDFLIDSVDLVHGYELLGLSIESSKKIFLIDYALKGIYPLVRSGWIDWSARGREVGRIGSNESKVEALAVALERLAQFSDDPIYKSKVRNFIGVIAAHQFDRSWLGSSYYWNSDFLIHQTEKLYGSVRVTDGRLVAAEALNGENSSGYWASFGATYLKTKGDEYTDSISFFDWTRIPGVTSLDYLPRLEGYLNVPDSQAAGFASTDVGFVGFRFSHLGLSASRSWFFLKNQLVMLGAGIASANENGVITTIAQIHCREIHASECIPRLEEEEPHKKRVYIGGLVYSIDTADSILLSSNQIESTNMVKGPAFYKKALAWIDHGKKPKASTFILRARFLGDDSETPQVIANDPVVQAISLEKGRVVCALFHTGGELRIARDLAVKVNQYSALLLTVTEKGAELVLAAPVASTPASVDVIKNGIKVLSRTVSAEENAYLKTGASLKISF